MVDGQYKYRKETLIAAKINGISLGDKKLIHTTNTTPTEYYLKQNYPNPFNPLTTIEFYIPESGNVELKVYDILGREVAVLINNNLDGGTHKTYLSAANLSSGVYFYTLKFNGKQTITKKMILAK